MLGLSLPPPPFTEERTLEATALHVGVVPSTKLSRVVLEVQGLWLAHVGHWVLILIITNTPHPNI